MALITSASDKRNGVVLQALVRGDGSPHLAEGPAFDDGQLFLRELAARQLVDQAQRRRARFQFVGTGFQLGALVGHARQQIEQQRLDRNAGFGNLLAGRMRAAAGRNAELNRLRILGDDGLLRPVHEVTTAKNGEYDKQTNYFFDKSHY
jgi:hypothetical protein